VGEEKLVTRAIVNMPSNLASEVTMRLQPMPRSRGLGDESPTVAFLDRWRNRERFTDGPAAIRADGIDDERLVREVIFGDAPAPPGLDPEMIAAARRIARWLHRNEWP
jgi:hypothetical protein